MNSQLGQDDEGDAEVVGAENLQGCMAGIAMGIVGTGGNSKAPVGGREAFLA